MLEPYSIYSYSLLWWAVCKEGGHSRRVPASRGEYEITDLTRVYLEEGRLHVELLGQGFTWLDTGNHESLVDATVFVQTVEQHQHRKIGCLEEIAYLTHVGQRDLCPPNRPDTFGEPV